MSGYMVNDEIPSRKASKRGNQPEIFGRKKQARDAIDEAAVNVNLSLWNSTCSFGPSSSQYAEISNEDAESSLSYTETAVNCFPSGYDFTLGFNYFPTLDHAHDKSPLSVLSMSSDSRPFDMGYGSLTAICPLHENPATSQTVAESRKKGKKTAKKSSFTVFPGNVKSLLSTGMFDGVCVRYVSWSREKTLQGTISGTGYLCGCNDCNLSKVLSGYEFEQHAGCKTKHPNNHIYFMNGKSIYAVVQELRDTPREKLFEAILNVTGSAINQKKFDAWKASFQAV